MGYSDVMKTYIRSMKSEFTHSTNFLLKYFSESNTNFDEKVLEIGKCIRESIGLCDELNNNINNSLEFASIIHRILSYNSNINELYVSLNKSNLSDYEISGLSNAIIRCNFAKVYLEEIIHNFSENVPESVLAQINISSDDDTKSKVNV